MTTNIFSIYKRVGREIIQLSRSRRDEKRLKKLIEEFEVFAAIPEVRKTDENWIETVEEVYKDGR